jgi:flagellar hook-associated protein 1 FlgK
MAILDAAISGLLVSQRSLATVSHNISNVHTDGYSRQRVDLSAREAQYVGVGYIGSGAQLSSITRIADQFINSQLRSSTTSASEANAFLALASRIDNMLGNEETGLNSSLQNFFAAIQDVNDLPSSASTRQVLISEAESLASRFQFMDQRFDELSNEIEIKLGEDVSRINTIAGAIADINSRIVEATGVSGGAPPNDLLDQRDLLVLDLAEIVTVSTLEQDDGSMNIFIGKGQPLVISKSPSTLGITESYEGHYEITVQDEFTTSVITNSISGGSLGGQISFQSTMLEPTRNALGRIAIGLADNFNSQHRLGSNLDGEVNIDFFSIGAPQVAALNGAPINVSAAIVDPLALSDSDYELTYNGANSYTLLNLNDLSTTVFNTGGTYPYTSATIDGFTMTVSTPPNIGDQYIVRPTINGSSNLSVLISDPRKIAIAGALKGSAATDNTGTPTNIGSGQISDVDISNTTGVPLPADITLTFDAALNQFNLSIGGTLAYDPTTENLGKQFTIAGAGNATFSISGFPEDGDSFVIQNNTGADGDNRNGLLLNELQSNRLLLNGSASFQDAYGQIIADVGSTTRQTEISSEALTQLQEQTLEARESVSGVNLDEEAANMLKFQQSYSAAAQMISVADSLFNTLINTFR